MRRRVILVVAPRCDDGVVVPNLDGVRVKLNRAKRHVEELRAAVGQLDIVATNSIVGAPSDDDPSVLVYRVTDVPNIEPYVSAIAGDLIHNLRTALDHVAWQLVLLDGGEPNETTTFPLVETATKRDGTPRAPLVVKPGISDPQIMAAVAAMQPIAEAHHGHDPKTDALGIIGRLNNIDKHRLLLTVVHALDRDLPAYWGQDDGDPSPTYKFNLTALATNDVVATFDFGGASPPARFDPHLKLTVTVAEADGNWAQGLSIVDVLDGLRQTVARELNMHIVPLMAEQYLDWG